MNNFQVAMKLIKFAKSLVQVSSVIDSDTPAEDLFTLIKQGNEEARAEVEKRIKDAKDILAGRFPGSKTFLAVLGEDGIRELRNTATRFQKELARIAKELIAGKTFNLQFGVGKAKYVVNYYDGKKTHKDGSPFYDIAIFRNKKHFDDFVKDLKSKGYKEEGWGTRT